MCTISSAHASKTNNNCVRQRQPRQRPRHPQGNKRRNLISTSRAACFRFSYARSLKFLRSEGGREASDMDAQETANAATSPARRQPLPSAPATVPRLLHLSLSVNGPLRLQSLKIRPAPLLTRSRRPDDLDQQHSLPRTGIRRPKHEKASCSPRRQLDT